MHHAKRTGPGAEAGLRGAIRGLTFKDIVEPISPLTSLAEGIADWDVQDSDLAQALAIRVLPSTTPYVIFQYRVPMVSSREFGCEKYRYQQKRHIATKVQTGIVTVWPNGPVGAIIVRLRPEAAARLLGERMQEFSNGKVDLHDIFRSTDILLLEEMLAEATSSSERLARVARFLLDNSNRGEADPLVSRAVTSLRRNPLLRIRLLAAELDVSERHLSRKFEMMFGIGPKQFARTARIEKVFAARAGGSGWADLAYACGFADQAHMINDFGAVVGVPPEQALRPPPIEQDRTATDPRGNREIKNLFF
jgi:AraC-like DNA-binding protein